jgi:sulfur carrier protein
MNIFVNGQSQTLTTKTTVLAIVQQLCGNPIPAGVAVALNSAVVPRSQWEHTILEEDDSVEILWASSGG